MRTTYAGASSVVCALIMLAIAWPATARTDRALTIFHADSLTGYMAALAHDFEASHRGVEVQRQAAGSLDAIRRVTDLHLPSDIVVTADSRLLEMPRPGLEPWVMIFAGNSLGLLYSERSPGAKEITAGDWFRIITRPSVRYGHSNPERDPAGYWTLIVWRLAERYYKQPDLAARLEADCPAANIRPKSIDFIPLLQSGDVDYFFGYSSDAKLGGLKFLELPQEINLSDPSRAAEYALASVEIGSGENRRTIKGAPIEYGVTMPSDPPNRGAALDFLRMMAGEAGRRAATQSGLIAYPQALAIDRTGAMPAELKALCRHESDSMR